MIWRFMDFTKYVAMLHERALYFTRADQLADPFEGALTWEPGRSMDGGTSEHIRRQHSERTLLSCWHQNNHESVAMWRIYSSSRNGVAIRTTVARLKSALQAASPRIRIAPVRYIHVRKGGHSRENPFFFKRAAFDYEREIRALWSENRGVREAGRYLPIDLSQLVERIVVSPASEPWFEGLVRSVSEQYDFHFEVSRSELRATPSRG